MKSPSPIAMPAFTAGWLHALMGNGSSSELDPDSWEGVRALLRGSLYEHVGNLVDSLQPTSYLDLCTGNGAFARVVVACPSITNVIVTDLNADLLALAERNLREQLRGRPGLLLSAHEMNVGKSWGSHRIAGITDTKWNLVTCSSAAMFLDDQQVDNLLSSVRQVMSPDGMFLFSFLSWSQGCGTYERKRAECHIVRGKAPNRDHPEPFAYVQVGTEHDAWSENFRPENWWRQTIERAGFRIEQFIPMVVPDDATHLRQDKFPPGARTYDLFALRPKT